MKKLFAVKAACNELDEDTIEKALEELTNKQWAKATKDLLSLIAEKLLYSEFNEIVKAVDGFVGWPPNYPIL